MKKRAIKTITMRILSMLAAIALTAGSVYAPAYAAEGDGVTADTNMTQVSEADVLPDHEMTEATEESGEPDEDDGSIVEESEVTDPAGSESAEADDTLSDGAEAGSEDADLTDDAADESGESAADEELSETADEGSSSASEGETQMIDEISEAADERVELLGEKTEFLNNRNAFWDLSPEGVLTITGTGKVDDNAGSQITGTDPDAVKKIVIDKGITSLGNYAFSSLTKVTDVKLPDSLTGLGQNSFQMCSSLTRIEIPNGVTVIDSYVFGDCTSLEEVRLPNKLTKIENGAFNSCTGLKSIVFPDSLKEIGQGAFSSSGLEGDLVLPKNLDIIGAVAFTDCQRITSVHMNCEPSTVAGTAFSNCTGLRTAYLAEGIKTVPDNMFCGCADLTEVHMPDSITKIGANAFKDCSSLRTITLPSSLTAIGEYAFSGCSAAEYIVIPSGIKTIGESAFWQWSPAADVSYDGTKEQWKKVQVAPVNNTILDDISYIAPVTGIVLDTSVMHLFADAETPFMLTATLTPADAAVGEIEFSSDAPDKILFSADGGEATDHLRTQAVDGSATVTVTASAGIKSPVTITARSVSGACKASCTLDVIRPTSITLNAESVTLEEGETYELSASVLPEGVGGGVIFEIDTNDGSGYAEFIELIDTGSADGRLTVKALKAGDKPWHVVVRSGMDGYRSVSRTCTVYITASDVEETDVKVSDEDDREGIWVSGIEDMKYTGQKLTQDKLKVFFGNKRLTEKVDYTLSYKNNVNAAAYDPAAAVQKKTPTVTVTLKGQYSGKKDYYFSIDRVSINDPDIEILEPAAAANGSVRKLIPQITYKGNKLKNGKDFKVLHEYTGTGAYKAVGVYPIVIEGKGNYTDSTPSGDDARIERLVGANMDLAKAAVTIKPKNGDRFVYAGKDIASADVEVTMRMPRETKDLKREYFKVTVISPAGDAHVGKATVRAEVTEAGIAAGYGGRKDVTITIYPERQLKAAVFSDKWKDEITYNPYKPMIQAEGILTYGTGSDKVTLTEGTDYTISYSANKKVGKATATIKGKGRYGGTVKKTYKIVPNAKRVNHNKGKGTVEYTKGGVKPGCAPYDVSDGVEDGNRYYLREKIDYTVSIVSRSNIKPGVMTYKITGRGNYKGLLIEGAATSTQITAGKLDRLKMTVSDMAYTTRANKWKSKVTITDTNGKKLKAGVDYEKTLDYWFDGMSSTVTVPEAGTTVYVTATGKGYYKGTSLVGTYRIYEQNIGKLAIVIDPKTYTGRAVELSVEDIHIYPTAKDAKAGNSAAEILSDDEIYSIVGYSNNINSGTARVTLRGRGLYGGEKTYTFKIDKKKYR